MGYASRNLNFFIQETKCTLKVEESQLPLLFFILSPVAEIWQLCHLRARQQEAPSRMGWGGHHTALIQLKYSKFHYYKQGVS